MIAIASEEGTREVSPQLFARIGGLFYLVIIILALFAEVGVRSQLIVSGDAGATAHKILSQQTLWRFGLASDLIAFACDVAVAWILYVLLSPVSRNLALLAAFFRLAFAAVATANLTNIAAVLVVLSPSSSLSGVDAHLQQSIAYQFIRFHGYGFAAALVFFGIHCIIIGTLVIKSVYLPRFLGALLVLAGVCYVTNSLAMFVAPSFQDAVFPYILLPGALAEYAFTLWLLVRGVNLNVWKALRSA